jgi:hypothetical protein
MKMRDIEKQRNLYFKLNVHEINFHAKYFKEKTLDLDVFLPSLNMNLQRDLVWTLHQKQELILSILFKRNIPRFAVIGMNDESYQVIDGKQRLNAIFDFIDSKFPLVFDDGEYYINDLPDKYRLGVLHYNIPAYICYEDFNKTFPDKDKVLWFGMINYFGTEQDQKHLDKLKCI